MKFEKVVQENRNISKLINANEFLSAKVRVFLSPNQTFFTRLVTVWFSSLIEAVKRFAMDNSILWLNFGYTHTVFYVIFLSPFNLFIPKDRMYGFNSFWSHNAPFTFDGRTSPEILHRFPEIPNPILLLYWC